MLKLMNKLLGITVALCLVLSLSGCGKTAATEAKSNEVKGDVILYTSQPDADAQALVSAFQDKYPEAKVEIFRSGTEEVVSKLLAENEAGSVQADILLVADSVTFERLKEKDLLIEYKSSELNSIPEQFVDPEGMYTGTKVITSGIIINKKNVKSIPDSWSILLDSASKNKAKMPSPLYSGAAAYNLGVLTRTEGIGWDFYEKLRDNEMVVGKGNGGILKAVAAGEKDYGMVVDFIVARAEKEGSPVKFIYPKEGVPAITEPIGIIKNTDNPAVAKAFVDFILSKEGQNLATGMGYTPIREGIEAPEGLKAIKDVKILSADNKELLKSRDSDKKQFSDIFK